MLSNVYCWRGSSYGNNILLKALRHGPFPSLAAPASDAHIRLQHRLNIGPRAVWLSQSATTARAANTEGEVEEREEDSSQPAGWTLSSSSPAPLRRTPLDPSSPHHSLATFQAYALRTGLSIASTVYTGTIYEYLTQSTLHPYGFELHKVGGRGDRGVDLIGIWRLPVLASSGEWKRSSTRYASHPSTGTEFDGYETRPLKVLVQCKRLVGKSAKIGPYLIRELDGAVRGARNAALFDAIFPQIGPDLTKIREEQDPNVGTEADTIQQQSSLLGPAIGVLVSTKPATKGVVDSMRRSTRGLVWVMMQELSAQDTETIQDHKSKVEGQDESNNPQQEALASSGSVDQDTAEGVQAPELAHSLDSILRGSIKQILWNQAARDLGLEGVDVVKRYDSNGQEEVVLMQGTRVWGGDRG